MSKRTLHRILKNFGELIIIKFIFFSTDRLTSFRISVSDRITEWLSGDKQSNKNKETKKAQKTTQLITNNLFNVILND